MGSKWDRYPEGIEALSPGLPRQRLPWGNEKKDPNPARVASFRYVLITWVTLSRKQMGDTLEDGLENIDTHDATRQNDS